MMTSNLFIYTRNHILTPMVPLIHLKAKFTTKIDIFPVPKSFFLNFDETPKKIESMKTILVQMFNGLIFICDILFKISKYIMFHGPLLEFHLFDTTFGCYYCFFFASVDNIT